MTARTASRSLRPAVGNRWRGAFIAVAVVLVSIGLLAVIHGPRISSPALIADDLIMVPMMEEGSYTGPRSTPVLFWIMDTLVEVSGTVTGARLLALILAGLTAGGWYVAFRAFRLPRTASAILALLPVVSPATVDQIVFLGGSHPSFALLFWSYALAACAWLLRVERPWLQALLTLAGVGLLCVASLISTVLWLAPLGLIVLAIYAFRHNRGRGIAIALVAIVPAALPFVRAVFDPGAQSHYVAIGWVNFDPAFMVERAGAVLSVILRGIAGLPWPVLALAAGCAVAVILSLARRRHPSQVDPSRLPWTATGLSLIASGALSFGPVLTVPFFDPRYLVGPVAFTALGLGAVYCRFAGPRVASFVLVGIATVSFAWLAVFRDTEDDSAMAFQEALIEELATGRFEPGAQLVIVADGQPPFTGGYLHWSTWFVRHATGRDDLSGLIGRSDQLVFNPFVEELNDAASGPDFWFTDPTNGQDRRKTMVGLVEDRPVAAYRFAEGHLVEVNSLVNRVGWTEAVIDLRRPPGGDNRVERDLRSACPTPETEDNLVFSSLGEARDPPAGEGSAIGGNGTEVRYALPAALASAEVVIMMPSFSSPEGAVDYPRTVLQWGDLLVQQGAANAYRVRAAGRWSPQIQPLATPSSTSVVIRISYDADCRLAVEIGEYAIVSSVSEPPGQVLTVSPPSATDDRPWVVSIRIDPGDGTPVLTEADLQP